MIIFARTGRNSRSKVLNIRGMEWYLEERRSRKILARSRNIGSVFDGSRSLVFALIFASRSLECFLPTDLGVSDLSFFISFWSAGVELFQSSRVQLIELS